MPRDTVVDEIIAARRRRHNARIGAFEFSDIGDVASSAVSSVADVATSAIDAIPGGKDLRLAVDSAVTGPVRDFANTAVGRFFLSAVATTMTGWLVPFLGPQLATLAFAVPGLAAGDDFVTAWTQEFGKRVEQTAGILGDQYAGQIFQAQLDKLNAYIEANNVDLGQYTRNTFTDLANKAGVTDVVTAYAVGLARRELPSSWVEWIFDPRTGRAVRNVAPTSASTTYHYSASQFAMSPNLSNVPSTTLSVNRPALSLSMLKPKPVAPISATAPEGGSKSYAVLYGAFAFLALTGGIYFYRTRMH